MSRALLITAMLLPLVLALLAGCTTHSIILRHPDGRAVECGPYWLQWGMGHQALDRCVRDYQRQGYERAPR